MKWVKKIFKKLLFVCKRSNSYEREFKEVCDQLLTLLDSGPSVIAFCFNNTGSSCLGMKNATLNLFPESTLLLPAFHANLLLTEKHQFEIMHKICASSVRQVIFSGIGPEQLPLVPYYAKHVKVKVIFHGALSELSAGGVNTDAFSAMVKLAQDKTITSIGFVKSGLEQWAKDSYGIDAKFIQLFAKNLPPAIEKASQEKINIGVFGNGNFNKNIPTQLAAALLVPNAVVHTFHSFSIFNDYFSDRVVYHEHMDHDEFISLLGKMDLNLHVSFSESTGGQIFMDSIGLGVPCITSRNNNYLTDSFLMDSLVVNEYDNPHAIAKKAVFLLKENQTKLKEEMLRVTKYRNATATSSLKEFLD